MITGDLRPGSIAFETMVNQDHRTAVSVHDSLLQAARENLYVPHLVYEVPDEETVRLLPGVSLLTCEVDGRLERVDMSAFEPDIYFDLRRPNKLRGSAGTLLIFTNLGDQKRAPFDPHGFPKAANAFHYTLLGASRAVNLARNRHVRAVQLLTSAV